jgi:hypothetical protein
MMIIMVVMLTTEWILKKVVGKCRVDSSISEQQPMVDIYQYDNEFIRCGYFLN